MSDFRKLLVFLLSAAILASVTGRAFAQSGIFDRTGHIPGHGAYSTLSEESVDLFTGNLTLSYRDIFIPGANGLNIEVWRVYNSKVLYDRPVSQPNPTVQAYPKSMLGLGWTMHMGMIHDLTSNTPVIEFPDGRREMAFPPKYSDYGYGPTIRLTRDFLMLDKGNLSTIDPKLYFQNGVVWTFGNIASLPLASGSSETVYMVTRIEDPLGNFIDIEYDAYDSLRSISKITDSMGREVRFVKSYQGGNPAKLVEIRIRNYNDSQDVTLSYNVGSYSSNGYYRLLSFTPPELPATTFDYNDGPNVYELTKVTTSYGGVLEYSYVNHSFYFSTIQLDSRVVSQKRIVFNAGEQAKVWDYTYPTYQGASTGTTTVTGPEYSASATHYGYQSTSANRWRIGLQTANATGDGSGSSSTAWTYHEISTTPWYVLGVNMGTAKGPLVSVATENRTGDSTLATYFFYLRTGVKMYGLPTKLSYIVNGAPSAKSNKELAYFYEGHASFKNRYMLDFVETEEDKTAAGSGLRKTVMSYYEEDGKWGMLDQVKRWKDGSNFLIWDYDYHVTDPQHQSISVDGPGDSGVSSVGYSFGLSNKVSAPDFVKSWKSNTKYGYVSAVWNQYDHSIQYVYDDLGRVAHENYYHNWPHGGDPENPPPAPDPYLTVYYNWRPDGENKVVITRGGNTVTKYWDGMGRDLGYTENGDDTTLYYLKRLDAEGRVQKEYKGSTIYDPNWTDFVYSYLYDASGRVTSITDPVDETSTITYVSHTKTVTDPENHPTIFEYNDLPGLPTQVTDAQSHAASYIYDAVGRLKTVNYLGRTQSYNYDWLDNVTSESHPETGLISYEYDTANRLFRKTWGGTQQTYVYNASGQILHTSGAETVNYVYNEKGALTSATGLSGWSRTGITYNDFGSVTAETVTISGLGSKNLTYAYDAYGNLLETTYPDGNPERNKATVTINELDRPATLAFNTGSQTSIVTSASYGPNKILAEANYGNGTSWSSTFYDNGAPHEVALRKDSTHLYNATYGYDGAGNITSITSTAPAPAMNSSFVYDSLNRLTFAAYSTGSVGTYSYEYDAYGNMLKVNGGQIFNKTYNAKNQIDHPDYQYDSRGNLTASPGKIYEWDTQNRLQTLRDSAGQYVAGYRYDDRGLRIASYPPLPDINVYNYPTGSSADITASLQSSGYKTFTITNLGPASLNISSVGFKQDADWEMFHVSQAPVSPVLPNQSTEFTVQFSPTSTGNKTATLQIASNDPDENPYEISLRGFCEPEIEIANCGNGGTYDFGTETVGESQSYMFYLQNYGTANLVLYEGWPVEIEEQGGESNFYLEDYSGGNEIQASGHNTFTIRFAPMSEGFKTATVTIWNNDLDENPYTIYLTGTGIYGTEKIIKDESELALLSPNGGERLEAGAIREIRWKGGERAKAVKLEYSTDNGTSYQTIIERAANVGSYPWLIPQDIAGSCLVRISDADGSPTIPALFAFEFNFRATMTEGESLPDSHFVFRAGVPDPKTQSFQVAEVAFAPEGLRGSENLLFNYALGEIQEIDKFLRTWHHARITYDMTNYTGSVWIDNQPIVSGVPLKTDLDVHSTPEISLSRGPEVAVKLWIDDLDVRFVDLSRMGQDVVFRPLFRDNFNRYERALFPGQGGWLLGIPGGGQPVGEAAAESGRMRKDSDESGAESAVVDDREFVSSSGSFKLEGTQDEPGTVLKRFSLPDRVPFAVSAEPFAIVGPGQESQAERPGGAVSERKSGREGKRQKHWEGDAGETGRNLPARNQRSGLSRPERGSFKRSIQAELGDEKMLSGAYPNGTYYIYSFDGRLLAEYDVSGFWIRGYIYFGGRLVAEYRAATPQPQYYFYASDQINSTRIVTDINRTVVYSAAHEPYGGIQQTWVTTFDPELKFSGKPRDAESELNYFGAISISLLFAAWAAWKARPRSRVYWPFSRLTLFRSLDQSSEYSLR